MIDLSNASRRLDEMPSFVAACAQRISRTYRTVRPSLGSFSLNEHLCHLRDVDREGYAIRIARLAEEVLPDLVDVDGNALAVGRDLGRFRSRYTGRGVGAMNRARRWAQSRT